MSVKDRFLSKIEKNPETDCWIWTACQFDFGYGKFRHNGQMCLAHRVSFEIFKGPIPDGLDVLHNCPAGDNPLCVNPDHLKLGDHQDNMNDKIAKGRQHRGASHSCSKLSDADIVEIRRLSIDEHLSQSRIASLFNISQQHVSSIVRNSSRLEVTISGLVGESR